MMADWNVKNRIVMTCYDAKIGVPPYAEAYKELMEPKDALAMAVKLAEEECAGLLEGFYEMGGEGHFAVDEGGADSLVAVRWYSVRPEEMEENSCDIETVTKYNCHDFVTFSNDDGSWFQYRGFEIFQNRKHNRFAVEQNDVRFCMKHSLNAALDWIDDFCLPLEKSPFLQEMFSGHSRIFVIQVPAEKNKEQVRDVGKLVEDATAKAADTPLGDVCKDGVIEK